MFLFAVAAYLATASGAGEFQLDDRLPYDEVLFAGTHNSAINLGTNTWFRPSGAKLGAYPSEAHKAYQYLVMDQRLSVRDQLEQGIRVIDLEVAEITGSKWDCTEETGFSFGACEEARNLTHTCFKNCPFIVSHGSIEQSVQWNLGFTFPEPLFLSIVEFVRANPSEIVTLLLINTHGNRFPSVESLTAMLNITGLLEFVWNVPGGAFNEFPTLGEMRASKKTVLVVNGYGSWGPQLVQNYVNATGFDLGSDGSTCINQTPCLEGWDAVTFDMLQPNNAVLGAHYTQEGRKKLFFISNLSSRRGRRDKSVKYFPCSIAHEFVDFPYQAGGNPAQASRAAEYEHIVLLHDMWLQQLQADPHGSSTLKPNWILVDFFNTTTPGRDVASRTLLPNENEGLIVAVRDINMKRQKQFLLKLSEQVPSYV